jgi:small subunit ribosomal protein S2
MAPFIYGKRNGIHIIDIRETLRGLLRAKKFITRVVSDGGDVLFVGTKRQAREIVQRHAERSDMHYVTERWLGGTLTNFRTIRSRLQRLEELEGIMAGPQWESGYSKKMKSMLTREYQKIKRNLEGVRRLSKLPAVLVVIDVRKEHNAVREARSLDIPTICLTDTDSDPNVADIMIPGNDDAMRGIELIVRELSDAALLGVKGRPEPAAAESGRDDAGAARRRPRRDARGERPPRPPTPEVPATVTAPAGAPAEGGAPGGETPAS